MTRVVCSRHSCSLHLMVPFSHFLRDAALRNQLVISFSPSLSLCSVFPSPHLLVRRSFMAFHTLPLVCSHNSSQTSAIRPIGPICRPIHRSWNQTDGHLNGRLCLWPALTFRLPFPLILHPLLHLILNLSAVLFIFLLLERDFDNIDELIISRASIIWTHEQQTRKMRNGKCKTDLVHGVVDELIIFTPRFLVVLRFEGSKNCGSKESIRKENDEWEPRAKW